MATMSTLTIPNWIYRYRRYEFWPVYLFYFPFFFYWLYLGIKAWDLGFLFKINPGMKFGGAIGHDKYEALSWISPKFRPNTTLIEKSTPFVELEKRLTSEKLPFPLIAKPNHGERGKGVEKLTSLVQLQSYQVQSKGDFLLQPFVKGYLEFGIFYYRCPYSSTGQITSIVQKGFLKVEGDGFSSLLMLLKKNKRAKPHVETLRKRHENELDRILTKGEVFHLEPIGNHSRGTEFINASHLIDPSLVGVIDQIVEQIPGFEYGRLDIKIESIDKMYQGLGIKVLEVNGVNSEPGHIYDKTFKLLSAYKEVKKHFDIMYSIYQACHKQRLADRRVSFFACLRGIKQHLQL